MHQAPQAILQSDGIEIQQQSHLAAAHPQIGEKLRFVRWHQPFNRLDLNDQVVRDKQVGAEARAQAEAVINNRHRRLTSERDSSLLQFEG